MLRILLVDDEPIVKAAFHKMIPWEEEGYEITSTASNGQEALNLLAQQPVDVVITDLKMPQMDGISLIKALKANAFEGVILVLSNFADFELVREALVAGAADYMLKVNIDRESLLTHLRRAQETLAARHQNQRREQFVAQHSALVRSHALLAYLTADREQLPPQALLDAYAHGPFGVCLLSLLLNDPKGPARFPSLQHVEALLRSIFEDVYNTDILTVSERALLCVYPLEMLTSRGIRQEEKLDQIRRQIGMYFNVPVLILTAPSASSLPKLRAQYRAMVEALPLGFYALPASVLTLENAALGPVPESLEALPFATRLAEKYLARGSEAVGEAVDSCLDLCREARTRPAEVAAFLGRVALLLLSFSPGSLREDALAGETAAWPASGHEQELTALVRPVYERILAQIVPPAYVGCKEEVRRALLYLHTHYSTHISLDDVARAASLDRSYLCRLFKRETGTNLFAYLNVLRMNAAARLIKKGDVTIQEIAGHVGIGDAFYFTRLFKKHFSMSPSEYGVRQGKEPLDKKEPFS